MDMLVGKQWRSISTSYLVAFDHLHFTYFTETKMIGPFFYKTSGGYITEIRNWDYKLSDRLDFNFSYKEQAKKRKNGRFLNYCGYYDYSKGKTSYNNEIIYLSNKMLILRYYAYENVIGTAVSVSE